MPGCFFFAGLLVITLFDYIVAFHALINSSPDQTRRPLARLVLARRMPLFVHLTMVDVLTSNAFAASRNSYL
jgi:hypothetical protein